MNFQKALLSMSNRIPQGMRVLKRQQISYANKYDFFEYSVAEAKTDNPVDLFCRTDGRMVGGRDGRTVRLSDNRMVGQQKTTNAYLLQRNWPWSWPWSHGHGHGHGYFLGQLLDSAKIWTMRSWIFRPILWPTFSIFVGQVLVGQDFHQNLSQKLIRFVFDIPNSRPTGRPISGIQWRTLYE